MNAGEWIGFVLVSAFGIFLWVFIGYAIAERVNTRLSRTAESVALRAIAETSPQPAFATDLGKSTRLRPGRLYPALSQLEDAGLIVGEFVHAEPRPRRGYRVNR